jgi:hypothetical protein
MGFADNPLLLYHHGTRITLEHEATDMIYQIKDKVVPMLS